MPITLGGYTFDAARTSAVEKYAPIGGRDGRLVQLSGLLEMPGGAAAREAALDAILAAASVHSDTPLSLRAGRVLYVRRTAFTRQCAHTPPAAGFSLELEARDPFEYAAAETVTPWSIAAAGAMLHLPTSGNAFTPPRIELLANAPLAAPALSDGVRTIAYTGLVDTGQTLVFDAANARATLDGQDVTPYVLGEWPRIDPPQTTLTYTDDPGSAHLAAASVAFRDRWW